MSLFQATQCQEVGGQVWLVYPSFAGSISLSVPPTAKNVCEKQHQHSQW